MTDQKKEFVASPAMPIAPTAPVAPVVVVEHPAEHKAAEAPQSASHAPAVALAGVPETPASEAGMAATGPAVPSTDAFLTEASPNQETSTEALPPPAKTAEVSGH